MVSRHFINAGAVTLVIFLTGVFVGYLLDSYRVEDIRNEYKEMEIKSNDARLQSLYYLMFKNTTDNFCNSAISENLKFSDKVYAEGLRIEQYEKVNKLAPFLITDKKRYVLLKLQFWLNSIELKRNCDTDYTNLVYFYSHYNSSIQQDVQSAVLLDLKNRCGRDMMLIPLPVDLNITTINIIKRQYNITKTPTILIDERIKLEGLQKKSEIEKYLHC